MISKPRGDRRELLGSDGRLDVIGWNPGAPYGRPRALTLLLPAHLADLRIIQQILPPSIGELAEREGAAVVIAADGFVGGEAAEGFQRSQFAGVEFDLAVDEIAVLLHDRPEVFPVEIF